MPELALLVIAGGAAAGFVSGLAGFAFGLIALVFWAWFLPPQVITPMLVVGSLTGQLLTIHTVRHKIRARLIAPFIGGGMIGVPIGVMLLPLVNPLMFRIGVGVLLIVYCGITLLAASLPVVRGGGRLADGAIGVLGGLLGGVAGLVGPAPAVWCLMRGWDKDTQRAVCQTFFVAMQSVALIMLTASGLITARTLHLFALMVPSVLVSSWLGSRVYKRLSDLAFRRILLVLLFCSGAVLLTTSLARALARHA